MKQFFEGDFSPPGWESLAFCTNLTNAYFGALGPELIIAQENLLTLTNQFLNGFVKHGLQTKACQVLHKYQPWEWDAQLQKRAQVLCNPDDFGPSGADWNLFHKDILRVSSKMGPSRMMLLIKSWLNSWTTTSRMDHEIGDCVFCCGGGDALHHYLRCDHLWTLLICCAKLDKRWLRASPAQRLGLSQPSTTSLLLITVASRVYHGMKARRDAGLSYPNETWVECSWALDLINHFLSEIPARLLAPIC